jgi:transposase
MPRPEYFIGIDVSADEFTVSVGREPWEVIDRGESFENGAEGFERFHGWLGEHGYGTERSVACMESTGVYGQGLAYFLAAHGYRVAVEPPLRVKRAFPVHGHKNDETDSAHLAEYACRFYDELHVWEPEDKVLKQVRTLLKTREQLTKSATMHRNALKALRREVVRTPMAERMHEGLIEELGGLIREIDEEIRGLIEGHPFFRQRFRALLSVPGVGMQLASYMLVITRGGERETNARELASYLGVCPYEHSSGKSVYRRPHSRRNGSGSIRKLLCLAAMSLRTHNSEFKEYFLRKTSGGKAGRLVINNISNKLLRIICAVMRSGKPYIPGYVSLHPEYTKTIKCA